MAASETEVAYLCTLEVETALNSDVWVEIGEIKGIMKPNPQVEKVDVTHMKSPGRAREKKAGMIEYGEVTYPINWVPNGATDTYIENWFDAGDQRRARLTVMPFNATRTFPALPSGYPASAEVGAAYEAELTLEVAGAVVRG